MALASAAQPTGPPAARLPLRSQPANCCARCLPTKLLKGGSTIQAPGSFGFLRSDRFPRKSPNNSSNRFNSSRDGGLD